MASGGAPLALEGPLHGLYALVELQDLHLDA
jgi:hypothetical protein